MPNISSWFALSKTLIQALNPLCMVNRFRLVGALAIALSILNHQNDDENHRITSKNNPLQCKKHVTCTLSFALGYELLSVCP